MMHCLWSEVCYSQSCLWFFVTECNEADALLYQWMCVSMSARYTIERQCKFSHLITWEHCN